MDYTGPIMTVEDFLAEWRSPSGFIEAMTSGSTGEPKKIRLKKTDMMVSARNTCGFFNISKDSTLYLPLSPDYIAGKMMIVRAAISSARLITECPSNDILRDYAGSEISLLAIVPSQIPSMIEAADRIIVQNVIIGGGVISPHYEELLLKNGLTAYATYGMTETCSHVALRKIGSIPYKALPGFHFGTDCRGCLSISCEEMSFGAIQTNDIVDLISDNEFIWKGRYDNVINTGGIKVFPETIERKISHLIPERDFYITSAPDDKWGYAVVLVIEGTVVIPELESRLHDSLSKAEIPKEIVYVDRFERTYSGKVIRKLRENCPER